MLKYRFISIAENLAIYSNLSFWSRDTRADNSNLLCDGPGGDDDDSGSDGVGDVDDGGCDDGVRGNGDDGVSGGFVGSVVG